MITSIVVCLLLLDFCEQKLKVQEQRNRPLNYKSGRKPTETRQVKKAKRAELLSVTSVRTKTTGTSFHNKTFT